MNIAKSIGKTNVLNLYTRDNAYQKNTSQIPEIRMELRQQAKLLKSVANSILLMCLFTDFILIYIMETPFESAFGAFATFMTVIVCGVITIAAILLAIIVYFCASEITEQMKKLNLEV